MTEHDNPRVIAKCRLCSWKRYLEDASGTKPNFEPLQDHLRLAHNSRLKRAYRWAFNLTKERVE